MTNGQPAAGQKAGWMELMHGTYGVYTVLLNLGVLLYGMDIYLITTLMPSVVEDFGGVAYYAWATMLYVVGAIIGSAGYGPLRESLGGRKAYALGGVIYVIATTACALSPEIVSFLVIRVISGFGGGIVMAGSMGFISTLFEPRLRTRAIAVSSMTWIAGALLGPLLAGAWADFGYWRGAFWSMVPLLLLFTLAVWFKIPASADQVAKGTERRRFPLERLVLLGAGVVCIASSGRVAGDLLRVVLIVAALVLMWLAFKRDTAAENRLFPTRPLALDRLVGLGYWVVILIAVCYTSIAIYLPLLLQHVHQVTPLWIGFMNATMSVAWSIGSGVVAGLHGGRERSVVIAGPVMMVAGLAALALWATSSNLLLIGLMVTVFGLGVGVSTVHVFAKTMASAEPGEESLTASSLQTLRSLGTAFGAAMAGVVANLAGLETIASAETVSGAVPWVYAFNLIPCVLCVLVSYRFVVIERRPAPAAA